MLNHELAQLALQNRLLGLEVVTTGLTSLSATATGYARAAGSFLTDGFAVGMEVTPTGFTQTTVGVITALTALTMTIAGGREVEGAAGGRSLTVKLPALRAWENLELQPIAGRPYLEADYVPAPPQLLTLPAAGGVVEATGFYVVRWYGIAGTGLLAMTRCAQAVLALFKPGYTLTLSDGTALRYRENPAPGRGLVRADQPGWVVVVITIPWRLYSLN